MRLTKASFLTLLILSVATATADAQQASFAVAVKLHTTMSKPVDVAQLCATQPEPVDISGTRIQVDCRVPEIRNGSAAAIAAQARQVPPEVLVTF